MSWFIVKRGRLEYRGRINKQPFTEWCASNEGAAAIARAGKSIRFSLLGRTRAARRRLWRALETASRGQGFAAMVAGEGQRFAQAMADACYADALPRVHVAVGRLVLVPRALVDGKVRAAIFARLLHAPALSGIDEAVQTFVLERLVIEMDAALMKASPAPRRPVLAAEGWCCMGVRLGTVWADPIWAGTYHAGHLFMYELRDRQLTRRDYKALDAAIEHMSGTVSTLSRTARDAMLRAATLWRA